MDFIETSVKPELDSSQLILELLELTSARLEFDLGLGLGVDIAQLTLLSAQALMYLIDSYKVQSIKYVQWCALS